MSLTVLPDACIGCGACEFDCPTGAIRRPPPQQGNVFWIETWLCNDCGWCPTACPADCILPDPDTIVCGGRGCPVATAGRGPFAGWDCTRLQERCPSCDDVLWREPSGTATGADWRCARCDLAAHAACPKTLSVRKGRIGQKPSRRSAAALYEWRDAAGAAVGGSRG